MEYLAHRLAPAHELTSRRRATRAAVGSAPIRLGVIRARAPEEGRKLLSMVTSRLNCEEVMVEHPLRTIRPQICSKVRPSLHSGPANTKGETGSRRVGAPRGMGRMPSLYNPRVVRVEARSSTGAPHGL